MGRFQAMSLVFLAKVQALGGNWSGATSSAEEAVSISREVGITFTGPMALGGLAVCRVDPAAHLDAPWEAEEIHRDNCVSHNYFYLYRDGMEIHLYSGDWDKVEYYAWALEDYNRDEPLSWTGFFIARGRALAAYGKGETGDGVAAEFTRLRNKRWRSDSILPYRLWRGLSPANPWDRRCCQFSNRPAESSQPQQSTRFFGTLSFIVKGFL